jgi:hypothetical protein
MEFLNGLYVLYFFFSVNEMYVSKFKGLQSYFKTYYNITESKMNTDMAYDIDGSMYDFSTNIAELQISDKSSRKEIFIEYKKEF